MSRDIDAIRRRILVIDGNPDIHRDFRNIVGSDSNTAAAACEGRAMRVDSVG
jgi:hypothetical protein